MTTKVRRLNVSIVRKDERRRVVYGWAYQSEGADGVQVVDHSGETIDIDELEKAMHGFMKSSRESGENHNGEDVGNVVVECIVFTKEKLEAMGLEAGSVPLGAWIGVEVSAATFAKVMSGELTMFSIEGTADRVAA